MKEVNAAMAWRQWRQGQWKWQWHRTRKNKNGTMEQQRLSRLLAKYPWQRQGCLRNTHGSDKANGSGQLPGVDAHVRPSFLRNSRKLVIFSSLCTLSLGAAAYLPNFFLETTSICMSGTTWSRSHTGMPSHKNAASHHKHLIQGERGSLSRHGFVLVDARGCELQ